MKRILVSILEFLGMSLKSPKVHAISVTIPAPRLFVCDDGEMK